MLPPAYRRSIKNLLVVSAIGLSALFTFMAVFGVPSARADHDEHNPLAPGSAPSRGHMDPPPSRPPSSASAIFDVSIVDFAFNPSIITITAGSGVRWTRSPASFVAHTTTSDAGSPDPWDSGQLAPGESFTKTFNLPGAYAYHCELHSVTMRGTVVVLALQPPNSVSVSGPALSAVNTPHVFTATVAPITATQPLTFVWEATGQLPVTHTGGNLLDTASFTWAAGMTGTARITATAMNAQGSAGGAFTTILIPQPGAGIADVRIVDSAFQPAVMTVTVGTTVRWTNIGAVLHTVSSDTGLWDSGDLGTGGVFTRTFMMPGTFDYHCNYHPELMKGTVVVLALQPPNSVSVSGPALSAVNTPHVFTATVAPITATQPLTFVWEATGQLPVTHTGGSLLDTASFTWAAGMTGTARITATAMNAQGSAGGAFTTILIPQPGAGIADVRIVDSAFQPDVITVTTGTTVRWTNIGAVLHTVSSDTGLWDSGDLGTGGVFTRTFMTPGTFDYHCNYHPLQMTGKVVVLAPGPQPPATVSIAGPLEGMIDVAYTFTATVSPITATRPFTYFWQATGQLPVTHISSNPSDTAIFTWTPGTAGAQLITATVMNEGGTATGTQAILFKPFRVYLPLILK